MSDSTPLFRDPSRSRQERLQDLISRLTLPEKIGLMTHDAQGVPRLGIPAYNYWSVIPPPMFPTRDAIGFYHRDQLSHICYGIEYEYLQKWWVSCSNRSSESFLC
jgi:hypothetical protein